MQKINNANVMNKKLMLIIATALLLAVAYLLTSSISMPLWAQLLVYLVPYILIGHHVIEEAVEGIMEGNPFDENFLMSIATIGAMLIGFLPGAEPQFLEGVFVMLFFQIGEYFEHYAEHKSRHSIAELMDIRPDTANVEKDGIITTVSPDEVEAGGIIIIKPGEKVPIDGIVVEGRSSLNTVALTGESLPRSVGKDDEVISGSLNISSVLKIKTTKTFGESTASKIIKLVESSAENKSKSETFIRRFAHVYTPIVVVLALAIAFIPPFFHTDYFEIFPTWLYRALTFLVVSCPCALVISIPLTFFAGIGGASRKGILIKGGNFMDTLVKASTVVFDKTGTLTKGVFAVDVVHPDRISETELLHLAAHVERFSTHPIASALRTAYPVEADDCKITDIEEIAGQGVRAKVNGDIVCVGNEKMMHTAGAAIKSCHECEQHSGTTIHVAVNGSYAGHIVISDHVKDDAVDAVKQIRNYGIKKTVMLTGDNEQTARSVAQKLNLDEYHAALLPGGKVLQVERMIMGQTPEESLIFIGDGINDAPVLARADVGIAMGGLGSDAAIEAADIVIMDDKPSKIADAIRIAGHTIRIARQNAWFAIGIKVLILLLVAFGMLGTYAMPIAVFGDVGVMVLCVINAMRALRV